MPARVLFAPETENRPLASDCAPSAGLLGILAGMTVLLAGCGHADPGTPQKPTVAAEVPQELGSLVEGLRADRAADRALAASRLKHLGAAAGQAVPYLIDALSDPNWQVRRAAAEALGVAGNRQAVAPLVEVLRNRDGDWSVRAAAARSLGELGDPAAIEVLVAVRNDMNAHVRHAAVIALGLIGTAETEEPLAEAARTDSDAAVRFSAAQALED